MRVFLAVLFIFFANAARAEEAAELLARDLSKAMLTMQKPVKLYSYFNVISVTAELDTPQGRQNFLQRFFNATMYRFWDMNLLDSAYINSGPGLYAAIDPHISQSFGNTMVEILVPTGTRYLDIHKNVLLGNDTISALSSEGIISRGLMGELFVQKGEQFEFSRDTMKVMIKPEFSFFRKMVQDLFNREKITMAEYNWDTSLAGFCRLHSYSAFVMFGNMSETGVTENFGKTLVFKAPLPALTDEENLSLSTNLKFIQVLEGVKSKKTYREKLNFVNRAYSPAEKNELVNQTYSCEL